MTDLAKTLAELSAKATQGEWNHLGYCGQDGNIQGPRQEQIASLSSAWGKSNQTGHQCFANAKFIVSLVNAYRTGQLVPAQTGDVEADAARYRWLRDHSCPPHNFYISVPDEFHGVRYASIEVDAYIDAARQALALAERKEAP